MRVSIERAFAALKNCFAILDNKPFHSYKTQVKLVLACCILHNWILGHGEDECIPPEATWEPNNNNPPLNGHGVPLADNIAWSSKRDEWTQQMWNNRGSLPVIECHVLGYVLLYCVFFCIRIYAMTI